MGKPGTKISKKRKSTSQDKALNAFDTAVDDEFYVKGLRQQQDIDLDLVADERIRDLLSNQVKSEDDEDIDSDGAFGSDSDISLGEPDSDEDKWGDSVDEDELLPLSEVWDKNDNSEDTANTSLSDGLKAEGKESMANLRKPASTYSGDESSSQSDSEADMSASASDSLELSDSESSSSSDDENDEENQNLLREAIKSISGGNDVSVSNKKLAESTVENPFALPQASNDQNSTANSFAEQTGSVKPLSIPAPQRIKDRADREAAYDLAKNELDKWTDTIRTNRQAEHLQFPINPSESHTSASPFTPATASERSELEEKVASILNQSQLNDEKQASTFEETTPSKLSAEEVKKRRDQLRYMRDLMFREEQRAKRIKKIKSKSYRKIHKKERERMAELERSEDDENEDEGKRSKDAERDRALERATLRHKNNSKWAKQVLEHGLTRDSRTRGDIEEMLRQSDALRQKIRGDRDEDSDEPAIDIHDSSREPELTKKGVLGMKFMQDAEKRERDSNDRLMRDDYDSTSENENLGRKSFNPAGQQLKRDLRHLEEADEADSARSQSTSKNARRPNKARFERGEESIEYRQADSDQGSPEVAASKSKGTSPNPLDQSVTNPWLTGELNTLGANKVNLSSVSKDNRTKDPKHRSSNTKILLENTFGDTLIREKHLSLQQQDLVKAAFAGDDVVNEFNAEKQAEIDEDKDQEVDETLPGWGSWSNEKAPIQKIRKVAGINEKHRRDYKKADVIINEKLDKKASKYQASAVPFPFENRQQYERSLRMPIGQEWVTKDTFQRQTKPRVIVKRGSIIDPIRKPQSN